MPNKPSRMHVVPQPDGTWAGKTPGKPSPRVTGRTQAEAEQQARQFLKATGGGELVTHRPNGQIRDSDTVPPARDPFPPKDTK